MIPPPDDEHRALDKLLGMKVVNKHGVPTFAISSWVDKKENLRVFRCNICHKQVDGEPNLRTHLNGERHARNKQHFTEVQTQTPDERSRHVPPHQHPPPIMPPLHLPPPQLHSRDRYVLNDMSKSSIFGHRIFKQR